MKVTYLERIERRTAFSRKLFCPNCGGHEYEIVEILNGNECDTYNWFVQCPQCGYDIVTSPSREIAIARWKQCHA